MVKCMITGLEATKYFKANKKCYGYCCSGCVNSIITNIVNKTAKVKNIILTKSKTKGLVCVKLTKSQKEKLKSTRRTKKVSKSSKKPKKTRSRKSTTKRKTKRKTKKRTKKGGANTVGYSFNLKESIGGLPARVKNKGCNSFRNSSNEFN
jgi:hypothetical protein